ncbi:hypothetical protein JCM8547_008207 [Rhodosporidiobolus lusitaniae]
MDDDVASLHGVASLPSDSGFSSSGSLTHRKRRTSKRSTTSSSTATGSLNARLDRLSREMEKVAEATCHEPNDGAGRSLGIKRKSIARRLSTRNELGDVEGKATSVGGKDFEAPSPPKRRRSLVPTTAPKRRSRSMTSQGEAEGAHLEENEEHILLRKVVSPSSGKKRTVAVESSEEQAFGKVQPGLAAEMEMPSFMLGEKQRKPISPSRYSPQPDWISRYLVGSPAPSFAQPAPPPVPPAPPAPAQPFYQPRPTPATSYPQAYPVENYYEATPSPKAPAFVPAPAAAHHHLPPHPVTPLPFSTSGSLQDHTSRLAYSHQRAAPRQLLYESQLTKGQPFHRTESLEYDPPQPAYLDPRSSEGYEYNCRLDAHEQPSQPHNAFPDEVYQSLPDIQHHTFEPVYEFTYQQDSSGLSPPFQQTLAPTPPRQLSAFGLFPQPSSTSSAYYDENALSLQPPQLYHEQLAFEQSAPASGFWKHRPLPHLQQESQPGQLRFAERLKHEAASQLLSAAANEKHPSLAHFEESRPPSRSPTPVQSRPSHHATPPLSHSRSLSRPSPAPTPSQPTLLPALSPPSLIRTARTLPPRRAATVEEKQDEGTPTRSTSGGGRGREGMGLGLGLGGGEQEEMVGRGGRKSAGGEGGMGGKKAEAEEGEGEEIKFDWDIAVEGEKLLASVGSLASSEGVIEGAEKEQRKEEEGGTGGDGWAVYEDPVDPIED